MKKFLSSILVLSLLLAVLVGTAVVASAAEGNAARIGDTEYATLEEAIKLAPKNTPTTIFLLKDYTIKSTMAGHQYTQNITIDLGGHTLTSTGIALTAYRNGTTLTVQNGTVVGNSSSGTLRATYNGTLILGEGLTIKGAGGSATLVYASNGTVKIEAENGVVCVGGKADFKKAASEVVDVAASINRTYFGTLADAFATAQDGNTIKVENDIAVNAMITNTKNVTLDLNGKTITGTDTTSKNFSLIDNRGTLTITGEGTMTLTATVNSGWNRYSAVIANNPGGKLIVENGTIEHLGGTDMAYGIDNLTNGKGTYAETVINGGTIKSTYRAVRQFLNGVEAQNILTINGGIIEGTNKSVWMQDPNKNANTGKLTITEGATLNGDVYLFVTAGSTEWPVEVSIADSAVTGEVLTGNVPVGYVVAKSNGTWGVTYAVKIGNQGFKTLADAIAAAKDDDTITLMDNINLTAKDFGAKYDGYNTFFNISGKSITIDLNGKSITADVSETELDAFILGVFCTTKNGHLTLKGNGTVEGVSGSQEQAYLDASKGNKDYNYKFYSLLVTYDNDCSITVNGGNYELDYAGDSLAYTSCNEGIVVNGGTFKLGNLGGIRNGMPWVFNARGQNIRHVKVNGGSFCADIQHQYYPFEVEVPKTRALKYNNGMYEVVDAVAYVTEREWSSAWYTNEVGYATLDEAIAACEGPKTRSRKTSEQEVVVLLKDITLAENTTIVINKPVAMDLNGKTIYGENTRTATHNFLIDVKGGTLTASNGTIAMKHTGTNMGWNGATTVIDVTAGGVLNLNGVTVQNQGGTDMNFAVHMNNWGEVTLNADNCVFDATYCGVRVFNSGYDMNNVKITNSKLTGATRAFWVHNYLGDLDSSKHSDEAIKARLNLDIYGNNNTFEITGTAKAPIRYGFGDTVYFNAEGSQVVDNRQELQDAINNGSSDITLGGDIDLGELGGLIIP